MCAAEILAQYVLHCFNGVSSYGRSILHWKEWQRPENNNNRRAYGVYIFGMYNDILLLFHLLWVVQSRISADVPNAKSSRDYRLLNPVDW